MNLHRTWRTVRYTATTTAIRTLHAIRRDTDLVHRIQCHRCGTWVPAHRYNPRHYACHTCLAAEAATARQALCEHATRRTQSRKLASTAH
jgi:hypothetical protein